jgi:hypothetical protein
MCGSTKVIRSVTLIEAIQAAATVVACEEPGFKYEPLTGYEASCVYTGPDGKHCIVGSIIVQLGLPVPTQFSATKPGVCGTVVGLDDAAKAERNVNVSSTVIAPAFQDWTRSKGYEFNPKAASFLRKMQAAQDNGETWHRAFIDAMAATTIS